MSESFENRPSVMFWVISAALLLWGLASVSIYVGYFVEGAEDFANSAESVENAQAYADYITNIPLWALGAGMMAAVTRLFGAFGLLARQAWALSLYVFSTVLFLVALYRAFVLANAASVLNGWHIGIEIAFIALSIFAVCFAAKNRSKGILN